MKNILTFTIALIMALSLSGQTPALENVSGCGEFSDGDWSLGWSFTPDRDLVVTSLGIYDSGLDGLNTSHEVGIYEDGTQVLVASATVPAGTAGTLVDVFRYINLPTSVVLNMGTTYIVTAVHQLGDGDLIAQFCTTGDYNDVTRIEARWTPATSLQYPGNTAPGMNRYLGGSFLHGGGYPDCPSSYATLGALVVPAGQTWIFDTDAMTYNGNPGGVLDKGSVVYAFNRVVVEAGATIRAIGTRPISILSRNNIRIDGTIDLDGESSSNFYSGVTVAGAGGFNGGMAGGPGGGPGGGGSATAPAGGGGGGHGGTGGNGGQEPFITTPPGIPGIGGVAYGDLTASFCGGGSGGASGTSSPATGGAGGGGVFLGAETSIIISGTGVVTANGGNGALSGQGASGGASGGAIILDAPFVTNDGSVSAAGGNGGLGACCGDGGGGGGGRVYMATLTTGGGTVDVAGGLAGGPTVGVEPGQPGVLTVADTALFCCGPIVFCPVGDNMDTLCNILQVPVPATTFNTDTTGNPAIPTILGGCGVVTMTSSDDTTTQGCVMFIERTYTGEDENGDVDSCKQHFVVQFDTVGPVLTGVPLNDSLECASEITAPPVVTAADTCDIHTNVWINEIHYRNTGTDIAEFVEIAGAADVDLSRYSLSFINGFTGNEYHSWTFTGIMPNESNCLGTAVHFLADAQETLMEGGGNNTVDGVALILDGNVVLDFVTYGAGDFKTVKADQGPASGHSGSYINVQEPGNGPSTQSIYKSGAGVLNEDFVWAYTTASTPGALNTGQTVGSGLECAPLAVTFTEDTLNNVCENQFDLRRIWSSTDGCLNTTMDTQLVIVNDTMPPTWDRTAGPLPMDMEVDCRNVPPAATLMAMDNCTGGGPVINVWINEFHYDNVGTDVGEFIEVAGLSGTDLLNYSLALYNGSNGTVYNTIGLTGIIDDEGECMGAVDFQLPTNGLQNGSPDGIALVDPMGTVLEFISYEGIITATAGPAVGIMSIDVGVVEGSSTPIGFSLQKSGTGQSGPDFIWIGPADDSPGDLNTGQMISPSACEISMLTVEFLETIVPGDCDGEYTIIRDWSTMDDCGNDTMWTQTLTVIDTVPPVACEPIPNDTTIDCTMDMIPVVTISGIDECDRSFAGPVWINEIHYDNTGTDAMEFVEIAGFNGVDITGFRIVLYNGSTGRVYNDMMMTGTFASQACGFGFIHVDYPSNGIQNGSPDGIALVDAAGSVVQFLSYEGTFTAVDGPAMGMLSTDIGVSETSTTPLNFSLQLSGTGTTYSDFTWMAPTMETSSAINNGQFIEGNIIAQPVDVTVPGTCPVIDSTFRTWTLTDDCGNMTTVMQTIVRQDTTPPVITCGPDFTVYVDEFGEIQLEVDDILVSILDECSTAFTYTIEPNGGLLTCQNIGFVNNITLTAFDECLNPSSCTVGVMVLDTVPPVLTCPGDMIVHLGPDECDIVVWYDEPTAIDNCEDSGVSRANSVLIIGANNQTWNMEVRTGIMNNSSIGTVDAIDGRTMTPTLAVLMQYDAVMVYSDFGFQNTTVLGNNLADYIDAGGGVVTAVFANASVPIGGRFNSGNYWALQPAGQQQGITMTLGTIHEPGSPLVAGVTTYNGGSNSYHSTGTVQALATRVADYNNGDPLIVRREINGTNRVDLNLYPPSNLSRTDFWVNTTDGWTMMVNALNFVAPVGGGPTIIDQIDNTGLTNGGLFPIGETCLMYMATDFYGNTSTCEFCITVENYPNEITTLQCNNNIQLSLDGTCMIDLNADMILEGGPYGCAAGYDVVVTDDRGNVQDLDNDPDNGTQLGWEHVGHCYRVTVYDPDNGNSCWGTVCIEDKMRPTVLSCDDYTVSCGTNTDPACFGGSVPCPVVIDNCDPMLQSSYVDWETIGSCAQGFDRQIQRRWTFTDQYGNTNSCEQTITVELGTLFDVAVPGDYDDVMNPAFHCDEKYDEGKDITPHIRDFPFCVDGYLLDSAVWYATGGDPTIVNEDSRDLSGERLPMTLGWNCIESGPYTGHPSPRGEYYDPHPQWEFFGVCWGPNEVVKWQGTGYPQPADCGNIQYTYRDTEINLSDPDCNAGAIGCFKVLRQWTVIDWCTGEVGGHDQIIKVLDDEGPQIVIPDVLEVGTDAWKCEGIVPIPAPWIIDNCSEDVDYDLVIKTGQVLGNSQTGFTVVGLPLGQHILYIRAYDCCGNTSVDSLTLDVRDNTPPVCISEDRVQLSLTGNQTPGTNYSSICAVDLDQASYDNCTQWVWFKTIRMDELLGTVNGSFADNTAGCGGVNGDDDAIISGNQVYFDDCAKFCCEDADQIIMVVLRVHDVDPGVGPVSPSRYTPPAGDLVGRFTDCWVEIDVRDKAQPIVVAPPDIVVSCMFWFDDSEDALSDPNNATFGRVVTGLNDREKVKTIDIVCEQWCEDHPKYDYEPSSNRPAIWTQACDYYNAYYDDAHPDDKYELVWGFDGYVLRTCGATPEIRVDDRRECGQGLITRDILVTYQDPKTGGVVSYRDRQEIWVIDCDPFYVTEDCFDDDDCVEWPRFCQQPDPLDGCGADLDPYTNPDLGYPVIVNGCDDNCALVAVDYDDEVYTIEDTACFKVIRTWIIIDWCQYDPLATKTYDGDNPNEVTAGRWEFVQSIVVRDKVDPVITVEIGDCEAAEKDPDDGICYGHLDICADATDDCSPDTWLVYDYKIDAYSDGVGQFGDFDFYVGKLTQDQASNGQVLSQGPTDCEAYNQGGYCNPFADDPTQPFCASGTYPVGVHTIYWFVEDGCGNVMKQVDTFEILDCKAPTPYCKAGIITVVMPSTQSIDIWASDLDDGSFDNCTEQENLIFSFSSDTSETSRTFDCDDLGTIGVEIWVTDEEGNQAFCLTFVRIQDNNDVCGTTMNVAGNVENALMKERVEDVDVFVSGQMLVTTDASGQYTFPITPGTDIEIAPYKNNDPMNGISTGDVVAIQRHLLGKDEFISGYQMIAADINNNQNVTAADISALRQLILGRFMDFTQWNGQTSWRFIDRDENLTDNVDPWPFPETRAQNDVQNNMFDENFDAVKIGDLNGDAQSNGLTGNSTRGNGNVLMVVEDADLSAGNTYTMEVTSDNFNAVSGYQFTMKYDESALAFTGVESGALVINGSHVGTTSIADGLITMSWNDAKAEAISVGKNVVLFKMNFEVLSNSKASEAISMNSLMTRAEAYDAHIEVMGLDLEFRNGAEVVEVFELYQNVPNPFAGKTIVGYTLPREMVAVLTVYDVSGKVLLVKDLSGSKGYNETAISRTELNGAGVLYYQLDAADYTATKRMVLID